MVEESVFDCGENNNGRSGEEEEVTTINSTTDEKANNNEYESEKEERVQERRWSKRVSTGAGDLSEYIPESEEEEQSIKEANDGVLSSGKDTKENCKSSKVQTFMESEGIERIFGVEEQGENVPNCVEVT
ncbi:hypothetical protein L6452_32558 [Arctium lappa]|uniref:Uncharacterized protein n=1 Tax=Arctium lappa TaxID=4217 RepID=A0ACB8Z4V3_ARCLA|nr:hypothetical protein L6452_32558 [Arctium lappa]